MFLCPLINQSLGNVIQRPLAKLFLSEEAKRFRKQVGRFPECRDCTEPGVERVSLPREGFAYLSLLFRLGSKDFMELHHHLGLEKYC